MRRILLAAIVGIIGAAGVVLLLTGASNSQVLAEATPGPYVLYLPLVVSSPQISLAHPVDWCVYSLYQGGWATGDGLRGACASSRTPETAPYPRVGTGRAPSPSGGYGTMAARTFLRFPEGSGVGIPTLVISNVFANGTNAAPQCWLDVHVFTLPLASWTMPFTITQEMWGMVGERLGAAVVDVPRMDYGIITVSLSGFSPAMVVLSRCEIQHELCATDPYKYGWALSGRMYLEWQEQREP